MADGSASGATAQRCILPVFLSGGFITAMVVNPPERRVVKCNSVHWYPKFLADELTLFQPMR